MNFEDLQKTWQGQNTRPQVTLDADVLLQQVRRNEQHFRATIFWRDVREVGASTVLAVMFLGWAVRDGEWSLYVLSFACLHVAVFILADRRLQRRRQPAPNQSLVNCVQSALNQVVHQIWLLKGVWWWYLLPLETGLGAFILSQAWHARHAGPASFLALTVYALICGLICWGVARLNRRAVHRDLEPRRQELETLLAELQ